MLAWGNRVHNKIVHNFNTQCWIEGLEKVCTTKTNLYHQCTTILDVHWWSNIDIGSSMLDHPCRIIYVASPVLDRPCWVVPVGSSMLDRPCWIVHVGSGSGSGKLSVEHFETTVSGCYSSCNLSLLAMGLVWRWYDGIWTGCGQVVRISQQHRTVTDAGQSLSFGSGLRCAMHFNFLIPALSLLLISWVPVLAAHN